jgi:hypothetical protein
MDTTACPHRRAMKKSDFEQEVERMKLTHALAMEHTKLSHAQAMEHNAAVHQRHLEVVSQIGEQIRTGITTQFGLLMPLYEHLGSEATAQHLRLQIEQGVAMVITLGEKALDALLKIEEARAHRHTATELREAVERALDEEEAAYRDAQQDALDEQAHLDRDVTGERAWFNTSFRIHPSGEISPLSDEDKQDDDSDNDEA